MPYTKAKPKFCYSLGTSGKWGWACPQCKAEIDIQPWLQCFSCKTILEADGPGEGVSEYNLPVLGRPFNDRIK